jgi:hypothetical protein
MDFTEVIQIGFLHIVHARWLSPMLYNTLIKVSHLLNVADNISNKHAGC